MHDMAFVVQQYVPIVSIFSAKANVGRRGGRSGEDQV